MRTDSFVRIKTISSFNLYALSVLNYFIKHIMIFMSALSREKRYMGDFIYYVCIPINLLSLNRLFCSLFNMIPDYSKKSDEL